MTDETGEDVPMTEPPESGQPESGRPEPGPDAGPAEPPTAPGWANPPAWGATPPAWDAPPATPPASPAWEPAPPAWGSASQGWPPPPPSAPMPPPAAPGAPSAGPVQPPWGPPPGSGAGGSGGGGNWSYGYGGMWSPPPQSPRQPAGARRIVAAIAVVTLVLASGAVGAIISAAVHNNPAAPAASPFTGNPNDNNGFGPEATNGGSTNNGDASAIAAKVNPALVNIYTTIDTGAGKGEAAGTGMVITSSGEVLTNNHVIADSTTVRVEMVATGDTHTAKVLGYDVKDDVALLQIEGVSNLDTVSFADARKVAVGDDVVAIGNAGGRGGSPAVTSGSVTALDQKVTAGDQGNGSSETLTGMIEISAPIEPGDSGGPLVNSKGQVIGMNTAAATGGGFGQQGSSTAFSIPINRARALAHQIETQEVSANVHIGERGLLGIRVQDLAQQVTCDSVGSDTGALVAGVQSGSPAGSAGLSTCDVIVSVGGKSVSNTTDLNQVMFPYHPDDKVSVGWVEPSGQSRHAELNLISGPPV